MSDIPYFLKIPELVRRFRLEREIEKRLPQAAGDLIDSTFVDCCEKCRSHLRDAFRAQAQDQEASISRLRAEAGDLKTELALRTAERDQIKQSFDRVAAENRRLRGEASL